MAGDGDLHAAAGAGVAVLGVRRLLPVTLPVYSMRWSRVGSPDAEVVDGTRVVRQSVGWQAHAYALIAGSLVGGVSGATAWLTPAVYLLVLTAWIQLLSRSVTRVGPWTHLLRVADQGYAGTQRLPSLDEGLAALRRRFVAREVGTAAAFVAAAVLAGRAAPLFGGTRIHEGLLAGFLGLTAAEMAHAAATTLRNTFRIEHASADPENVDGTSEGMLTEVREGIHRFTARLGLVVAGYLALAKLAELLDVARLLHDAYDKVTGWF